MIRNILVAATLLATATSAFAGAIDRSRTDVGFLFEDGNRVKLSFSYISPDVSGLYSGAFGPAAGTSTGDMAQSFTNLGFGFKRDLNDKWAIALLADQPYGADALYHQGPYTRLQATWDSESVTFLGQYQINERVSLYGGPRAVRSSADVLIPGNLLAGADYTATIGNQTDFGVVVGAAYEIPAIALRLALTYQSEIEHEFIAREAFVGTASTLNNPTTIKLPQTVTLDFQSGVAADTLVFGSVRWSDWSVYDVRPDLFAGATGLSVAQVQDDIWSYSLGVGRRLNENLSVFARVGYEPSTGSVASRLAPADGLKTIGVGGTYTAGNAEWTGGVEYIDIGGAKDSTGTQFDHGDAVAVGLSVSFGF